MLINAVLVAIKDHETGCFVFMQELKEKCANNFETLMNDVVAYVLTRTL